MTDRYGVMGNPVGHSKSPFIHARFAEQTDQDLEYHAIPVERDHFAAAVERFRCAGGKGLNVTLPFKEEAWSLADIRTPRAELAGAVNTLWFGAAGVRHGDNTDGAGLVRDLERNHGARLRGRRLLLVGAGGAARGVLGPLLGEGPELLVVANRTVERAQRLAAVFAAAGPVRAGAFEALAGERFDVVINATSASLEGRVPAIPDDLLAPGGWCYDMMYADAPTAFVRWGEAHGAGKSVDGLGMLVEQAAESFYVWRGVRPETGPLIAELRAAGCRPGT